MCGFVACGVDFRAHEQDKKFFGQAVSLSPALSVSLSDSDGEALHEPFRVGLLHERAIKNRFDFILNWIHRE